MCACSFIPYKAIFLEIPQSQKNIDFCNIFYFFLLFIHYKILHLLKGKKFVYIKKHLNH